MPSFGSLLTFGAIPAIAGGMIILAVIALSALGLLRLVFGFGLILWEAFPKSGAAVLFSGSLLTGWSIVSVLKFLLFRS